MSIEAKRRYTGETVFDASLDRLIQAYNDGHRIVCTFSAGKDSGVVLEMALLAAEITGNLPLDVVMRDEEIMYPGTFEYAERVAARPEVNFHWLIAGQPIVNIYNRASPYWWVFDDKLDPDQWVRQPPDIAEHTPEINIESIASAQRFPHAEGKKTIALMGLRAAESPNRNRGLHSSGGWLTKHPVPGWGQYYGRPIYDWSDGDIWKAIRDNQWDYNDAYDVMNRLGVKRHDLRIAPPTMMEGNVKNLAIAARAWPKWFDKVCKRCPGVRNAANYGKLSCTPISKFNESWEETYHRLCVDEAPEWIKERSLMVKEFVLKQHAKHSSTPFPDTGKCYKCSPRMTDWRTLTRSMYNGDPFAMKFSCLEQVEPTYFREDFVGQWGKSPAVW